MYERDTISAGWINNIMKELSLLWYWRGQTRRSTAKRSKLNELQYTFLLFSSILAISMVRYTNGRNWTNGTQFPKHLFPFMAAFSILSHHNNECLLNGVYSLAEMCTHWCTHEAHKSAWWKRISANPEKNVQRFIVVLVNEFKCAYRNAPPNTMRTK